MPRGGRRPGAGAKPGNLNALKHGLRSAQFARLGLLLASVPETRQALLDLARRHELKQRRAEEIAAFLLARVLQRGIQIGNPRSNAQASIDERRKIKQNAPRTRPAGHAAPDRAEKLTSQQSNPESGPPPTVNS